MNKESIKILAEASGGTRTEEDIENMLTPDNTILKSIGFTTFCRSKYEENMEERGEHGEPPYANIQEYLNPNTVNFLLEQYKKNLEKYASG
jgi:hypothetical protein